MQYNTGQVGSKYLDQKVLLAWLQGYTGKGVSVSIVDDGVFSSHPDLSNNFVSLSVSLIMGYRVCMCVCFMCVHMCMHVMYFSVKIVTKNQSINSTCILLYTTQSFIFHQDLEASYDFVAATNDPTPYYSSDSHGTNCAGVVAMERDNGYCGVGVAYDSQIGGNCWIFMCG